MSSKKKLILVGIIIIIFIFIASIVIFDIFNMDNTANIFLVNQENENSGSKSNNDGPENDQMILDKNEDNIDDFGDDKSIIDKDEGKSHNINDNNEKLLSESDVICYFQKMGDEVERSNLFKEKFKEYFIVIVDFIFYGKEINGYTFGGLSNTAKVKIISIALKIDSKIEQYSPNYKENISSVGNKVYSDVKEKLITSYFDISVDICNKNEEDCNKVKEMFGEIKEVCNIGWEFIKKLVKGGLSKVKDWYEIYSGK